MRSIVLIAAALLCAGAPLHAQTEARAQNAVYLELGGNGGLYSVNFDRRVADALAVRVGIATWTVEDLFLGDEAQVSIVSVPVTVSWVPAASNRGVEVGGGVLLGSRSREEAFEGGETSAGFVSLTGILGYRYQPASGGFMFRVAFTPFFGLGDEDEAYPDKGFFPSAGLSVGYTF
jgi:hypothetical protein